MKMMKVLSFLFILMGGLFSFFGQSFFLHNETIVFIFGGWQFSMLNILPILSILFCLFLLLTTTFHVINQKFKKLWFITVGIALLNLVNPLVFIIIIFNNSIELSIIFEKLYLNYLLSGLSIVFMIIVISFLLILTKDKIEEKVKDKDRKVNLQTEIVAEQNNNNIQRALNINPNFTSTPNEETFNIADKLEQLKNNLNNNVFQEEHMNSVINEVETQKTKELDLKSLNDEVSEKIEIIDNLSNNQKNDEISKNNFSNVVSPNNIPKENDLPPILVPKDPYKETIVPRRSQYRAEKFQKPIGNVVANQNNVNSQRKVPKYDSNYEGKVFLGDSDKIWEAMKKKERNLINNNIALPINQSKVNSLANSTKKQKTKTIDVDLNKILDPVNEKKSDFMPTIDWDD
ncbi:hypothetical protein [Spiroplasma taiwanense]|uniref:Transmembrane protein n=1 Tax=Spiroplasma taiwanense CT-1 TaxID=1276220 RepID=S5M0G3_9MOLU|nr:hypothetical protein [Spiroplasma taiwanense]AGR41482.1 hypothetical protein STAIW_v1c08960 [Spiroplasma taiwanense CT-1]